MMKVGDKRTARHDFEALCTNVLQHGVHHLRADAAAAQGGRDFRVGERHHAINEPIEGKRHSAIDIELEAMKGRIVADLTHGQGCCGARDSHWTRRMPWLVWMCRVAFIPALLAANVRGTKSMKTVAYVLGALLIVVAVIYLIAPADSLPSFFPGHETGLARPRIKHGLASGAIGVILLVVGWVLGRR
jgi:hypothetical protein